MTAEDRPLLDRLVARFGKGNRSEYLRETLRVMESIAIAEELQDLQERNAGHLAAGLTGRPPTRAGSGRWSRPVTGGETPARASPGPPRSLVDDMGAIPAQSVTSPCPAYSEPAPQPCRAVHQGRYPARGNGHGVPPR